MALDVYFKEDLANVLSSTVSMAVATSQATIRAGGQVDEGYLFGVFSAQRSTAKAFGLSWPEIVTNALCDVQELDAPPDRVEELASKPLRLLVAEIERDLTEGP